MPRKFLLVLGTLIAAGAALAQITIGPDDFPPVGTMDTHHEVWSVAVSPGSPGANQTYTIATQNNWVLNYSYIVDPATTPYSALCPTATFCQLHTDVHNEYEYFHVASDGLYLLGHIQEGDQDTSIMIPDTPMLLASLPCTYGTNFASVMHFSEEVYPGLTMHMTDSTAVTVDGWGTITSEFGTWPILRFQEHHFMITDTNGYVMDTQEAWGYAYRTQSAWQGVELSDNPDGTNPNFTQGDLDIATLTAAEAPSVRGPVSEHFALGPNYPNPFNPTTILPIDLDRLADVSVNVYDQLGRLVSEQTMNLGPGHHDVSVDGSLWASGTYFVRASDGRHTLSAKMQLIK